MIKLLLSIALGLSLQMANAQKDKVFYKTETGKIITEKQLNERVDRLKKVAQQISKKAKVNPIFFRYVKSKGFHYRFF